MRTKKSKLFIYNVISFILFELSACTFHQSKELEPPVEPNFASINQYIFQPKCASCHTSDNPKTHGIDLTSYVAIFNSNNSMPLGKGFIQFKHNRANAESSSLYVTVASGKMPPKPRPKLSPREIEAIRAWIENGAKEVEDASSSPPPQVELPPDRPPNNDD